MYRQGHGDCFLLAFPRPVGPPAYLMIDCGMKAKSNVDPAVTLQDVIADIAAATGGRLDVLAITHEHEDHVNGFLAERQVGRRQSDTAPCFDALDIDALWLAWTEDEHDADAEALRTRFGDTLLALAAAGDALGAAAGDAPGLAAGTVAREVEALLAFETGEDVDADADHEDAAMPSPGATFRLLKARAAAARAKDATLSPQAALAFAISGLKNKRAMKAMRDKVPGVPTFMAPEGGPYALPGVPGVRVFALGPPRDAELLLSLDPRKGEEFKLRRFGMDAPSQGLVSAARLRFAAHGEGEPHERPFSLRHGVPFAALGPAADDGDGDGDGDRDGVSEGAHARVGAFLAEHYGSPDPAIGLAERRDPHRRAPAGAMANRVGAHEADGPVGWRQIDTDWLDEAGPMAMRLNHEVNNTSLVLAIELPDPASGEGCAEGPGNGTRERGGNERGGKVLVFTGDAQRGSWISWADLAWDTAEGTVTARDLLARTVLYKVGHHGSHNATLKGTPDDDHANLSWMARAPGTPGAFAAMIPANETWARARRPYPWRHPLEAIREALRAKADGRVLQTDVGLPERPGTLRDPTAWDRFADAVTVTDTFIQLDIPYD
ncbi:MAG: hypothetical protein AAF677_01290 [Pseudomonadota bacterium]